MSGKIEDGLIKPTSSMVTYSSYLKVHEILSLQNQLSSPPEHDELLFIVIHQTSLWWTRRALPPSPQHLSVKALNYNS